MKWLLDAVEQTEEVSEGALLTDHWKPNEVILRGVEARGLILSTANAASPTKRATRIFNAQQDRTVRTLSPKEMHKEEAEESQTGSTRVAVEAPRDYPSVH